MIAADRMNDGLIIEFETGEIGFYSEAFLFEKFPESKDLRKDDAER